MKTVKLSDYIFEVNDRTTENDQYPVLTSSQDGIVTQAEYFNKKVASKDTTGYKIVRFGQFTYRAMSDTGRFYINRQECCEAGIVSPAYPVFSVRDNEDLAPEFLQMFFKTDYFQSLIANQSTGSTRVSLKLDRIKAITIPVPAYDEQLEMVEKLHRLAEIIKDRKEQAHCMDELLKSRFIELFGTGDDQRYPTKTLPELVSKEKHSLKRGPFGGALKKEDFVETGYLVYEQRHAIHDDFEYAKYFITEQKYQSMLAFKVQPGDLIVSCSGVTLGRIAEVPAGAKAGIINQALLKITLDNSVMTNTFFVHQFRGQHIQDKLFGFCRGSGIPNFPSMGEVKEVRFICPPMELQEQFAAFVEQTDKSKLAVQQGLQELEILKKSLMQQYFG